jgi:amino acid transporter
MARNEIDPIDVAALVIVPIAGATSLGVFSLQVNVFGGYSIREALFTIGGVDVALPLLLTVAGIAWILGTNEIDGSDYTQLEYGVIIAAFGVVPAYHFVPAIQNILDGSGALKLITAIGLGAATVMISYVE